MKTRLNKILSIILVAVMLVTAAPLSGFVGLDMNLDWLDFTTKASAATYSGSCGDNLTWTFDDSNGTLTISGTGEMMDFDYQESPWFNYGSSIENIVIENGITRIGDNAFCVLDTFTSILIPDSVESIGYYAFANCFSLSNVAIGKGVTSIDSRAFYCSPIEYITVDPANTSYSTDDYGVLFNKDKTELVKYPVANIRTSYTIPDTVTFIIDGAFYDADFLVELVVNNGVTIIGWYAFYGCDNLTDINIPNSVNSIGVSAFNECNSLKSITIPASVTTIGERSFIACDNLTDILVDSNNQYYSSDSNGVLYNKDKTEIIQYPAGNERTEFIIPDGVISIGSYAFSFCHNLVNVTIPNSTILIDDGAFFNCYSILGLIIPDSVTSIGRESFSYCYNLSYVIFGLKLKSVGPDAFYLDENLNHLYLRCGESELGSMFVESGNEVLENCAIHIGVSADIRDCISVNITPSTCTLYGEEEHTCLICDEKICTIELPLDHCFEVFEIITPVCGGEGYTVYKCSKCDDEYKADYTYLDHTKGEIIETVDPVCGRAEGYTVYKCSNCGEEYEDDHIWLAHGEDCLIKIIEPVCGESYGYSLHKCSNCNQDFILDTEWMDHDGELVETFEATCFSKGYSVFVCNTCSEQYYADYTDAIEHNFVEGMCSGCGINQNDLIESEHPYSDDTYETWTISKPGANRIAITFSDVSELENGCDYIYVYDSKDNEIACLTGTAMSGRTVIVPGERVEIRLYTDSSSNYYGFSLSKIVAYYDECTEHTNIELINQKDGNCWQNGYTGDLICLDCGVIVEVGSIVYSDHTKSEKLYTVEPTCNESGYTEYFCNICGCYLGEYTEPKHSSPIVLEVVNPVCGGEGYTIYQCSDCGEEYTEGTYLDHTKGEVIKTVDPVCGEAEGYTVYECSNCGKKYKDDWYWKNHDGELIETIPATCTKDSYNILECIDCGAEYEEWASGRLGHAMINGKCTRCDAVANGIKLNVLTDVNITTEGDIVCFMFSPEADGTYYFYSDSAEDTYGYLYDSESNLLDSCDDYDAGNFVISYALSAGETYYFASRYYSSDDTGSFKIMVSDEFTSNHSYVYIETDLPTCAVFGSDLYVCSVCQSVYRDNYVDPIGHNYSDGVCETCGCHKDHLLDIKPIDGSTIVLDYEHGFLYGIESGIYYDDLEDNYLTTCQEAYIAPVDYDLGDVPLGTGSVVEFVTDGRLLAKLTIIIFGDVNGDSWYNGEDAFIVSCLANGILTKDDVSESVYMAADCNHDGVIDSLDVALLEQAGLLLANVDQSKSNEELATDEAFIEYLDLIDQTPDEDVVEEVETPQPEEDVETPETEELNLIEFIINIIKKLFELLISYLPIK